MPTSDVRRLPPRRLGLFLCLSVVDWLLTWRLLHRGTAVYESNPVAQWILARYSWAGLAAFKLATAVLVTAVVWLIARHRPRLGARVLGFGCLALGFVVVYSCCLPRLYGLGADGLTPEEASLRREQRELDRAEARIWSHRELKQELIQGLAAGRYTLAEAVAQLERGEESSEHYWRRAMDCYYPGLSRQQGLAVNLVRLCLLHIADHPAEARRTAAELEQMYFDLFGTPVPAEYLRVPHPVA